MSTRLARFALLSLVAAATACDHVQDDSVGEEPSLEFRARGGGDDRGEEDDDCDDFATISVAKSFVDNGEFLTDHDWEVDPYSGGTDEWRVAFDEHLTRRASDILHSDARMAPETPEFCATTCDSAGLGWTGDLCVVSTELYHDDATATAGYMGRPVWRTNVEAVAEIACGCG